MLGDKRRPPATFCLRRIADTTAHSGPSNRGRARARHSEIVQAVLRRVRRGDRDRARGLVQPSRRDVSDRLTRAERPQLRSVRRQARAAMAELDAKWGGRWTQLDAKLEQRLTELRAELVKQLA